MGDDPQETADDLRENGGEDEEQVESRSDRDAAGRFAPGNPFAFQPGTSGNPEGRPKGVTRVVREILESVHPDDPQKRERIRLLFEAMYADAMPRTDQRVIGQGADARVVQIRRRGSYQHARELLDRAYGRVPVAFKIGPAQDEEPTELRITVVGRDDVDRVAMRAPAKALPGGGNGSGGGNGKP